MAKTGVQTEQRMVKQTTSPKHNNQGLYQHWSASTTIAGPKAGYGRWGSKPNIGLMVDYWPYLIYDFTHHIGNELVYSIFPVVSIFIHSYKGIQTSISKHRVI